MIVYLAPFQAFHLFKGEVVLVVHTMLGTLYVDDTIVDEYCLKRSLHETHLEEKWLRMLIMP